MDCITLVKDWDDTQELDEFARMEEYEQALDNQDFLEADYPTRKLLILTMSTLRQQNLIRWLKGERTLLEQKRAINLSYTRTKLIQTVKESQKIDTAISRYTIAILSLLS